MKRIRATRIRTVEMASEYQYETCEAGNKVILVPWCLCKTGLKVGDRVRISVEKLPVKKGGK